MRCHTSACRQDTFGSFHTSQILRRSFQTNQNDLLSILMPSASIFGEEDDLSRSCSRRCGQTFYKDFSLCLSCLVEYRVQQLVEFVRLDAHQSGFFVNHSLMQQVDGNLHHSCAGTFTVTSLQEPEFAFLYGKFHILHIAIVLFQLRLQGIQFLVDFRHSLFHRRIFGSTFFFRDSGTLSPALRANLRNLLRCTDSGYDIFALRVNQVFAVEEVFTSRSVAREANAGCRSIAHVTEYHSLHADGRSPLRRNTLHLAVEDGAFVHPAVEHGANSSPQLFVSTRREVLARLLLNRLFEARNQRLEVFYVQFVVQADTFCLFNIFNDSFKRVDVCLLRGLHA